MDDWWNEFLPSGIVKSFHCHWRGLWRGLINEGASVRNALLCPVAALISPPATAESIDKSKSFKNNHGQWKPGGARWGWLKRRFCQTSAGLVTVNTSRGQCPCWEEGVAFYGERVLPQWHAAVMNVLPPSGFSTCNKYLHSCLTSLT